MPEFDTKEKCEKRMNLSRIAILLSLTAGVVLVALLVALGVTDNADVQQIRADSGFERLENISCREIEDENAPIGTRKEYTFSLNEILKNDIHLAFYTVHQYVDVYLDGQEIYSLKPAEKNRISKTVGSNWVMIPLFREDAGKEIRVVITPVYESFRNREVEYLVGSPLAIYKDRLSRDLPQLILGAMVVFVGIIFVCVAGYCMLKKQRGKGLVNLGLFSVMMGLWRLTDTRFTPFILPEKPVFLFYVSVTMLMIGMIPLIRWMEESYHENGRRILDGYCIGASGICLIQLLLQLFGGVDLRDTLSVTHIVIAVGIIAAVGNALFIHIKYPQKQKRVGKKLHLICLAGVMADIIAFYIKGNSSGLLFSLLAFLLYIVSIGIATMFQYGEQEMKLAEKDRQLAEKERKLTERRISAMMSQIRTHFIFNVLTAISGFCKYDPQKADETLILFARYLRRNLKIIEEEGLIDFAKELEQLEDYVALEQIRFPDMIQFEEEIGETNFRIPPLTVQPIVENAIKHGLVEHGRSGTVRLCTMCSETGNVLIVEDDGAGFVPEECEKEDSVGIRNVRYRLESMVNGSLTIESSPGNGTKVTIRIPKQAENK